MFQGHANLLLCIIIVCNYTYGLLHGAKAVDDPTTCCDGLKEDESVKYISTIERYENKNDPFVARENINLFLQENVESVVEFYNVTFTDINGQTLRIILNRTLLEDADSRRDIYFRERAREDAFEKTTPAENPFSVLILATMDDVGVSICTGSLLTREWVLTAAHCSQIDPKPNALVVYAGGYSLRELIKKEIVEGSQVSKSTEYYIHPEYHSAAFDADISVVKAGPFDLTDTVNLIKLSNEPWTYHSYKECKITGFGIVQINKKSKDDEVRKTHTLLVKNPCLCSFKLKSLFGSQKAKRYICSKPLQDYGVCPGDSGGGLVCDGEIKAVAIQLIQMRDVDVCNIALFPPGGIQCGSKKALTIFQDTCPFLKWINSHVGLYNDSEISPKCVYTGSNANSIRTYNIFVTIFSIIMCLYYKY